MDPKLKAQNLMMHAAYWKDQYKDAQADLIPADNKLVINENIKEAVIFLKNARAKVHAIENKGGDLTQGLWNIYQELDRLTEKLLQLQKDVNKEGTRITDLKEYPIE